MSNEGPAHKTQWWGNIIFNLIFRDLKFEIHFKQTAELNNANGQTLEMKHIFLGNRKINHYNGK